MQKKIQTPGNVEPSQSQHSTSRSHSSANDNNSKKLVAQNQETNPAVQITDQAIDVLNFVGFKL